MPTSPIIFEALSNDAVARATGALGEGLAGFYNKGQQKNQQAAQGTILEQALKEISQNPNATVSDVLAKMANLQSQGISPQASQPYLAPLMQEMQGRQQAQAKQQQTQAPLQNALKTIARQRELLKSGSVGQMLGFGSRKTGSTFSKEGRKDRAEYERLGKSLIQFASSIPIRNKAEFETLAKGLYDTDVPIPELEGSLDAIERIVKQNLGMEVESGPSDFVEVTHKASGKKAKVPRSEIQRLSPAQISEYDIMQ